MSDPSIPAASSQPRGAGRPHAPTLVVGLGASAGGIKALQQFFAHIPGPTGAAYVVILHLSPDHESKLAEVLQATTSMPVRQVRERIALERDHVYVVPPNKSLTVSDGHFIVSEVTRPEQRRAPIDIFFRTLADAHGARAASVILSGTGSDGSSGLKRVKEHGGLTIAQQPGEAEHGDMPTEAIATGFVDYVLPVGEMPATILQYFDRLEHAPVDGARSGPEIDSEAVRDVLTTLRVRTGQDFSSYKPSTVLRRIARRMSVHGRATLSEYAALLREHPDEARQLMKELLISVTNFFRDADAFAVLEQRAIPRLFDGKDGGDQVRVWVAGCATGEEAYSIAMLLAECAATMPDPPSIQVFATDLDQRAIAEAREAFYSDADVVDVNEDRLRRFFQRDAGGYRIRRELRELVLFAHHNVIKDPPFSHLDLVSCRNLLIYLNRPAQEKLIETFHFALRPGALLFLGTSEAADGDRFVRFDATAHLYESRAAATRPAPPRVERTVALPAALPPRPSEPHLPGVTSPGELHQRLLEQYAPPSLVVNEDHAVLHVSEKAGQYLEVTGGEPSRDLLKLARRELRSDLRRALQQAALQRTTVEVRGVKLAAGPDDVTLAIVVKPVLRDGSPPRGFFLIMFEEAQRGPRDEDLRSALAKSAEGDGHLEEELAVAKAQLCTTIEDYETQVEEAKASNEELQALNEELRSSTEELETSKEELQSVNEELTTVNQELKVKIEELALTNNDFRNFINSTDIGTVFLDRAFRVKLSTRRAQDIFNLLPSDTGRRLSDITTTLTYDRLYDDVRHVLDRLQPIEHEVQTVNGKWYLMRVLPYRTGDDRIEGVVLTFLDITSRRAAERRVRMGEERLRLLIDSAVDYAIFTMTTDGLIDSWNAGAQRMFGFSSDEIIGKPSSILFTPEDRAAGVPAEELRRAASTGRADDERYHVRKDGSRFYCSGVTTLLGEDPSVGFAKIARDLTTQREAEQQLAAAHAGLEDRVLQRTHELQQEIEHRRAAQGTVMALLRRLVSAQEDQSARIARDLHDHLGQQITALRLCLERYRGKRGQDDPVDEELQRALALTGEIDAELDYLAWELRPAALDDLGLMAALPRFLAQWSEHHGVAAEFRAAGFHAGQLSREAELTFYRIAQEALNNIAKHAHASRVDVILESRAGSVTLVIEDNGIGFNRGDPEVMSRGAGLVGMRERAALGGAALQVESTVGEGTSVFVRAAIPANTDEGQA